MPQELLLKAISYIAIGLLILPLLLLLLLGLRREIDGGNPLRGIVQLGLFLMGLICVHHRSWPATFRRER